MTKFGYVKIISGQTTGRIGRFVGFDEKGIRAKVAFGYDNDILPYTNYHFYSINSISNNITKQDLVDRYYQITQDLKAIDLRSHPRIRKYTADHTSVITECGMVRHLLQRVFALKNLILKDKEKNVVLITAMNQIVWLNELALDLQMRGFNVGIIDHELIKDNLDDDLNYALDFCDHFVFIEDYDKYEFNYLQEHLSSIYQSISVIVHDLLDEDNDNGYLYFGEPFTESFEQAIKKLIDRLENPDIYTRI